MKNIGSLDRILRIGVGAILLILGIKPEIVGMNSAGAAHWTFLIIGALMLVTGTLRFCPMYKIMNVDTCKLDKK